MSKRAHVYFLRCPSTKAVKYIGVTVRPERRLYEHMTGCCVATREWIASLDEKPLMDLVLSTAKRSQAEQVEARLQMFHRALNADFLHMPARYRVTYAVTQGRPRGPQFPWR